MEHGLGAVELGDGRQNASSVAGKEDDVLGVVVGEAGDLGVGDVLDRVGAASVLGEGNIIVVDDASVLVENDVLEDGAVADGVENIGLLLSRETDSLGVATTLNVEDAAVRPAVLVITDQGAVGVSGQGGLASAGKTEEESDIAVLALVGGRVKSENVVLNRTLVKHDGEDTLLHLAGILGTKDDHLLLGEVDGD